MAMFIVAEDSSHMISVNVDWKGAIRLTLWNKSTGGSMHFNNEFLPSKAFLPYVRDFVDTQGKED